MCQQRIARDRYIGSGNDDSMKQTGETLEEHEQERAIVVIKHSEPRQWRPKMTVERRWDPPHPATAAPQFVLFLCTIFADAIWRVGNDRVNRIRGLRGQPRHAVGGNECCLPNPSNIGMGRRRNDIGSFKLADRVAAFAGPHKLLWRIEVEVRANRRWRN